MTVNENDNDHHYDKRNADTCEEHGVSFKID